MARRSGGSPTHRVSSIPVQPWTMEGGGGGCAPRSPGGRRPAVFRGASPVEVLSSVPPTNVRSAAARTLSVPYRTEPSP